MKISQIQQFHHKLNNSYASNTNNEYAGVTSIPVQKSYADTVQNGQANYGKALINMNHSPSFGAFIVDDLIILTLSLIPVFILAGITINDIINSKYDTKIAMEKRLLKEAEVKAIYNEDIIKLANTLNISPKQAEKYHSKYLGASYIKPVGEPEKEIGMNAVRGYGMEKYELIKRLLTPVVFAQKSIARANGTQKEQDRIIALNAQKVVPGGILLYGPPGTGKTYIAEKIGEHLQRFDVNFINLKLLNTTDKNIEMFNEALKNAEEYKNRTGKYTVILLNDLNYSYNRGSKEFDMILENLDKAKQNHIIFILTANKASDIDKAFLRKGRLDIKMPIGNMETFEKADMINYALLSYPETKKKAKDFDIQKVVDKMEENGWQFTPAEFMDFAREMSATKLVSPDEMISLMEEYTKKDIFGDYLYTLTPDTVQGFNQDQKYVEDIQKEENDKNFSDSETFDKEEVQ